MKIRKMVIFDLDGTLLDTLDDLTDSVNYVLEKNGFPRRSHEEIRSFIGSGSAVLIKNSLPEDKGEYFEACHDEFKQYYRDHSKIKTKAYDGIVDLLKLLKSRGILLSVVSNKPDFAVGTLCKYYFGDLLSSSVGDRAGVAKKPSAEPVFLAMKELGCEKAVFVGDSEVDVLTASNADLPCVAVTWGFRDKAELIKAGAEHCADNASQLKEKIFTLLGEKE